MTIRSQVAIMWWGVTFLVIFGFSWYFLLGMIPIPPATWSSQEVAAFYTENSYRMRWGALICSWTGAFMIPIYAVQAVQIARLERGNLPIWAVLQFGGGVMMTLFLVMPPLMWGVAAYDPGRPADITNLMHQFANLMLVTTDQYFVFQMVPLTVMALTKNDPLSPFPRWFGYFNIWVALMFEFGVAGFIPRSGPFAWDGLFVFWIPLTLFGIWVPTMVVLMLKALKRQARAEAEGVDLAGTP